MEPIKIEDPKLAAKVDRIIEQLKEYYPDGKVVRITNDHKKLSERIGKAYKEIGYQSRDDFLLLTVSRRIRLAILSQLMPKKCLPSSIAATMGRLFALIPLSS